MLDKLLQVLAILATIAYGVAGPGTFVYLIATMDNWTLLNAVPYVLFSLFASSVWWIFWPVHWLFGVF